LALYVKTPLTTTYYNKRGKSTKKKALNEIIFVKRSHYKTV